MSNNPFSVPDSTPAFIDSKTKIEAPKSIPRAMLHVSAFLLILNIWYFGDRFVPTSVKLSLYARHTSVFVMLLELALIAGGYDYHLPLACVTEVLFFAAFSIVLWRRSLPLTLGLLGFIFCWTAINIYLFLTYLA